MPYEPQRIEPFWQEWWERNGTFVATEDSSRPKFYALDMFPYPSGKGLHVGHPAGYTASDVVSRARRAQGFSVLHPMGFDSFGLPAEQRAIEEGVPPQESTAEAIGNFRRQLKRLGFSYDWTREVSTSDPDYYKWTQAIFSLLYSRGLAYQADMLVNWCPALGTVLANDEVIDGKSERGGHPVIRKSMRQWMLKITAFADRLLEGLDRIDWPEATKTRQREWIGRSTGARISFPVDGSDEGVEIFTTRPDTIFGATYMVLAPEHPLVDRVTSAAQRAAVVAYVERSRSKSELDRQQSKEKSGVPTGAFALNPATRKLIPIWVADYVIYGYGTGAIMAVPAHDSRDFEFAKAMSLPIVPVISGGAPGVDGPHEGEGTMINSGEFDGAPTAGGEAVARVCAWLEKNGLGRAEVIFKLRDWVFARQRYWGEPIPVLKTESGEVVRCLDADELPVELPRVARYEPLGTGESPLAAVRAWVEVEDPRTGRKLLRETDTMPGSAGSSWYFLRYCDSKNPRELASREKTDYWMPVDLYVGGPEHTVGHLMYSRMWQKALFDAGLVRDDEPFKKLRHQGMILGFTYYDSDKRVVPQADVEERDGQFFRRGTDVELSARVEKMSKRKGNVVNPDDVIARFGADAMRVYICFMGPLDADKPWQTQGLEGQFNWLKRAFRLYFDESDESRVADVEPTEGELRIVHKAIKKVTQDIETLDLNTAISALHVATRDLTASSCRSRAVLEPLAQLIAPFAPHFAEEVWSGGLGKSGGISFARWPSHDPRWSEEDTIKIGVQVLGKTRGEVELSKTADEATAVAAARANPDVAKYLEGKELVRVVYKAGRILSFIIK
ncbi:MAG: leucine--tRNA ligase [Deltaproteobacteria bacterium]|nr:leucine--tRNA ligase [Deltaproteobacteria bacterium]